MNIVLADFETRAPLKDEARVLFERGLEDAEFRADLMATAAKVRDDLMAGREEYEAGINSVTKCYLNPNCRYCDYWLNPLKEEPSTEEVVERVRRLHDDTPVRQFHLSGGSIGAGRNAQMMRIVEAIREAGFWDMGIVVNCGPGFTDDDLDRLKELQVKRVFSVFETTDPQMFEQMKPGDNLERKFEFARRIHMHGLGLGSGMMAGLGRAEGRIERYLTTLYDMAALEGLEAIYISKFMMKPGIDVHDFDTCSTEEGLVLIAVARLILRDVHIRAAAGWSRDDRELAIGAGTGAIVQGPMR